MPAGQLVQEVAPDAAAFVPASQDEHDAPPAALLYWPAEQLVQLAALATAEYWPTAQALHTEFDPNWPGTQSPGCGEHILKPDATVLLSEVHAIEVLGETMTALGPVVPQNLEAPIVKESKAHEVLGSTPNADTSRGKLPAAEIRHVWLVA